MTSMSQLKEEERNFARFFFLNSKVSPEIARRFFDGVFPPSHLAQTINCNVRDIIKLHNKKIINAVQLEVLRGVPGTLWPPHLSPMAVGTNATSSKDFDLTLIICLLRNLGTLKPPSNGWDQLPHPHDTSQEAHLATLKWYRNQLAHTTVTSMDYNEFTDKWTLVEKALTSLNNGTKPCEVTEILNYDLDGEKAKTLANDELQQLKKEYLNCEKEKEVIESDFSYYREGHLPKNITEANANLVETWLKDDEIFHETKGSERVYDKIKHYSCILVTSNSGLGKTATIRHIAFKLKLEGYEIVPIESPEDIIKYKTSKNQVFLIDDVLGKYDLSPTLLEKWERINEKLMSCFKTELDSNKILCTLRSQIALQKRFKNASTILNTEVLNLEHKSIALSLDEKKKILIKHLRKSNLENEIETNEIEIMCETTYAFPLLCKLVSLDEERFRKRIAFFRQPLSLFKEELDKMSIENKKLYCILVLCMLFNGSFDKSIFDIGSNECDEKIYKIIQTCRLKKNMSKKELEDSAISAIESYFTMNSTNFKFIHDALEETIGCHFFEFDPKVMCSYCDILFIRDRVRIISSENSNDNSYNKIVNIREDELNEDCFKPLYCRLYTELKNGTFSSLLMCNLLKNRNFVRIFVTNFDKSIQSLLSKPSSEQIQSGNNSALKQAIKILSYDQFQEHKDAISRVIRAKKHLSTLIDWIVAFGSYEFFQYLWSKMSTFDRKLFLKNYFTTPVSVEPLFPLAVLGGSLDIVTELISHGANVNCFSEHWETPLYIAVNAGRHDMVNLLLRNGAHVNPGLLCPINNPIAVASKTPELTSLLLEYDLKQTVLHEAVRHNDLETLRSSIQSENIDSKTKSGLTVLHYAVLLNNLEAVKVLFHEDLPANDISYLDFTSDNETSSGKPTPKLNIANTNGLTAVHLAVINNNIKILSFLLCNKAEVKVRDDFHRTPLHYATDESVTKLLLSHSSKNRCLGTNRNADEKTKYEETKISVCKTACFNVTLQTTFRCIFREFVNVPDKEGNTPLHSLLEKRLSKDKKIGCIKTLLDNGANPYLRNNRCKSASDIIYNSNKNSAKHRKSIQKTLKLFAVVTFILSVFTFILSYFLIINKESQTGFKCVEQFAETSNIELKQFTRSQYVFLTIGLFVLLSMLPFDIHYSVLSRRWFLIFVFLIVGCVGSFILLGTFVHIHLINNLKLKFIVIAIVISLRVLFELWIPLKNVKYLYLIQNKKRIITVFIIILVLIHLGLPILVFCSSSVNHNASHWMFSTKYDINTLKITASNCTKFNTVNILCTGFGDNRTYYNGVDFIVQCHTNSDITSDTGILTVNSGLIDWLEIGCISLFWLNAICVFCFLQCISHVSIVVKRKFFRSIIISRVCFWICILGACFGIVLLTNTTSRKN